MRVTLCVIGRLKKGPLRELTDEYIKRLNWPVTVIELEAKTGLSGAGLQAEEGRLLLNAIPKDSYVIILDEKGKDLTSQQFSQQLEHIQHHHVGNVCFIIGGADGLHESVKLKAKESFALGHTTWPHMMVRVMLLEQIYRAQQILKGHPYHRD